jgi:hypothetical protein
MVLNQPFPYFGANLGRVGTSIEPLTPPLLGFSCFLLVLIVGVKMTFWCDMLGLRFVGVMMAHLIAAFFWLNVGRAVLILNQLLLGLNLETSVQS